MRVHEALDRIRRVYWRIRRPVSIGVRIAVLGQGGQILLVQHTYGGKSFYLPGGAVKRGERTVDAAIRELEEEVGMTCRADDGLALHGVFTNFWQGKSDHVVVYTIRRADCRAKDGRPSREIGTVVWANMDELPAGTSRGTRNRIAELNGERERTFDW